MIIYILLGLVLITITVFFGMKMSEGITHPSLLIFYWVVYIATILTIANAVSTVFFYGVLRSKRGIPGEQGRVGNKGESGLPGLCDTGCSTKACNVSILENINKQYAKLLMPYKNNQDLILSDKPSIKNREIIDNIKLICNSDPYKQITAIKPGNQVNNYISEIYSKWLQVLFNSDNSTNKNVIISYLETDGLEDKPDLQGDPFAEIEKYDIYYWGRDRVFSPRIIEYCNNSDINKMAPTKYRPVAKAIKTNMHSVIRHNIFFKMRKSKWVSGYYKTPTHSIYRVNPYTYEGTLYYPLGDWWTNDHSLNSTNKFIESVGTEQPKRIDFGNNKLYSGPNTSTILLAADDKYLMAPLEWDNVWKSTTVNRNRPTSVWKPRDYYNKKLGKWFRGCGFFININDRSTSPRHSYGFNTPEKQPFRLVNEDLLISNKTSNMTYLWDSKNSGGWTPISFWMPNDKKYQESLNLPVLSISISQPKTITYYTLNMEKFKEIPIGEAKFKNELVDKNEYGIGYFGLPIREEKYSIFSFLNVPIEVQLINNGNGDKIFLKHSGQNIINSYVVRRLNIGDENLTTSFGVENDANITTVNTKLYENTANPNQIWKIECIDSNNNLSPDCKSFRYLIKPSERSNFYLSSLVKKSTTDDFIYTIKPLPKKGSAAYNVIMQQFIWFKPSSATGNQLLMETPLPSSTPSLTPSLTPSSRPSSRP